MSVGRFGKKDASKQQARKKLQERTLDGKDRQEVWNLIAKPRPGRSCRDSSPQPESRQAVPEGSRVNSDMVGRSTSRAKDRLTGTGKRKVARDKLGPSPKAKTKG
ncbi:hypothetical protein PAXRUDRAFT_18380 [Paxillus rubicundulus Ve08.2h10]|uniref:Uncharacterized protein n=1 Tax=Paxillus rubicundulus Ve08.2h10 TaxID=930991 RepID=A0A0D0BYE7_9AGAM|nr:hypothetical protein PAXRUDRAFT_18380 [Paxillus rubicundulus Ve08.2h10]